MSTTLTLRLVKGTYLTAAELDGNFTALDSSISAISGASLPTGISNGAVLKWNGASWISTDTLKISSGGDVTVTGTLLSSHTGSGTNAFAAGEGAGDTGQGNLCDCCW